MNTTRYSLPRRVLAAFMAFAMTLGPLTPGAYAATTVLTDQPLAAKVAAKPNIIYTLDDSGSMQLRYIPDYTSGTNPVNTPARLLPAHQRDARTRRAGRNGHGSVLGPSYDEPMYASEFNRLYYNPNINYEPPVDGAGNQANPRIPERRVRAGIHDVLRDHLQADELGATPAGVGRACRTTCTCCRPRACRRPSTTNTTNLTTKFNARVFCNTDWPATAYAGPATATSVWTEVGDANGENTPPAAGKGADCRINGTEYAALNGAPAIAADYNYPWQKSSGANDPKYFWRNGGNRAIYCMTSAPGWPTSCVAGPQDVRRNHHGHAARAADLRLHGQRAPRCGHLTVTYPPVGCETNPLYQWTWAVGGCVGTIGVECLGVQPDRHHHRHRQERRMPSHVDADRRQRRRLQLRGRGLHAACLPQLRSARHVLDRLGRRGAHLHAALRARTAT